MTAPPAARRAYRQALAQPSGPINIDLLDQALDAAFEAARKDVPDLIVRLDGEPLSAEQVAELKRQFRAVSGGQPQVAVDLISQPVDDLIAAAVQTERDRILTTAVSDHGCTIRSFAQGGSVRGSTDAFARGYNTAMREVADLITDA